MPTGKGYRRSIFRAVGAVLLYHHCDTAKIEVAGMSDSPHLVLIWSREHHQESTCRPTKDLADLYLTPRPPSFPLSMRHAAVTEVDGLRDLEVLVEVRSHE